jgi:galactokinase
MLDPVAPSSPSTKVLLPPKLSKANLESISPDLQALVLKAKELYKSKLAFYAGDHPPPAYVSCAPGRVNLIGEHTDYNLGFVLPFCIDRWVVVYGTASLNAGSKGQHAPTTATIRMVSANSDQVVEERLLTSTDQYEPPEPPASAAQATATANGDEAGAPGAADSEDAPTGSPPSEAGTASSTWPNYVTGTVAQYMPDLPSEGCHLDLALSYASNVPLGAGLSSSAALEVATATLIECFFHDRAYSSASPADAANLHTSSGNLDVNLQNLNDPEDDSGTGLNTKVIRALRCQKAENEWAHSPCGIMDQLVSSAGQEGSLLLIDCRSMEITPIAMKSSKDQPVLLVTNSRVGHEIADSEYGVRRRQCNDALEAMQEVPLYHVLSLRDATLQDVDTAKDKMDDTSYKRAKHVVSENSRTMECKTALKLGLWERVGELMNASHQSLRDDYDVSCEEVNFLVDICQNHPGVYGSRMTGGGFGGCIVTLVQKEHVQDLVAKLAQDYKEVLGKECDSFVVPRPSFGAKVLAIDMDCKA